MQAQQYIIVALSVALLAGSSYGIERTITNPANAGTGLNELGIAALVKALESRVKVLSTELETVRDNLSITQNELSNTQIALQNTRNELQLTQIQLNTTHSGSGSSGNNGGNNNGNSGNGNDGSNGNNNGCDPASGNCAASASTGDFMVYVQKGNWDPFFGQQNKTPNNCPSTYPGKSNFAFKFSIFAVTQPYLANQKEGGHTAYENAVYCVYGA